jgi:uncharacterized protein YdhG (YjbR/CyaY superfamily)
VVQSSAKTVDAYLRELPVDHRPAMARLTELARRSLPGFEETMEHGMPNFRRDVANGVAFASQVRNVSIYFGGEVVSEFAGELKRYRVGVGCVRFPSVEGIDWDLLERMFRTVSERSPARADGPGEAPRAPKGRRKG